MKLSLVVLASFCASQVALASAPILDNCFPSSFPVNRYQVAQISFNGSNLIPAGVSAARVDQWTSIEYRRVSPTLGDWTQASFSNTDTKAKVTAIGRDGFQVVLSTDMISSQGIFEFIACVKTAGCSAPVAVSIVADPSNVTLRNESLVVDAGHDSPKFTLSADGLQSISPTIKIANEPPIVGDANLATGQVTFTLPPSLADKPSVYANLTVVDPISGSSSNAFMLRVFGAPRLAGSIPSIEQRLSGAERASDVTLDLAFAPLTAPTQVSLQSRDGKWHDIQVDLDLITNHAKIKVSGSYLVDGHYYLLLEAKNAGGEQGYQLPVTISRVTINPIPHPSLPPIGPIPPHP